MKPIVSLLLLLRILAAYNYRKYFQGFKHELESDIVQNYEPQIEEDDFQLDFVLSGREALKSRKAIGSASLGTLPFDLALLNIPKSIPAKLPKHAIKFSSGFSSLLTTYSKDPALFGETSISFRESPSIVPRPDDRDSVTTFAMMCSNAYIIHSTLGDWRNMTDWNQVLDCFT